MNAASFVWSGPVYEPTGYADEGRGLLRAMDQLGVNVALRPLTEERPGFKDSLSAADLALFARQEARQVFPDFVVCRHFPADGFMINANARVSIGRTMFETDSVPGHWVRLCNERDELWLPSQFNRETFAASGVRTPVVLVPGGIDSMRYHPGVTPLPVPGLRGTVFLSVFEWRYRKGWDVLLRAWANAFGPDDDVTLLLRTYPTESSDGRDRQTVIDAAIDEFLRTSCGKARHQVAPIVALTETLPENALPSLYTAAHAFVLPTRGEGWGRPFMEAMACGLPVIATRWSAHLEFMNDANSLLLDIEGLEDVNDPTLPLYVGQRWASPSAEHCTTLLRRVHADRAGARAIGEAARADMAANWTWARPAGVIAERLAALAPGRIGGVRTVHGDTNAARVILDADLFTDTHRPLEVDALLSMLPTTVGIHQRSTGVVHRPAYHLPAYEWYTRQLPASREAHDEDVTISWLRRSDSVLPLSPIRGRWIVATGDCVLASVPTPLLPTLLDADDIWVPHAAAFDACVAAGIDAERLWVMPLLSRAVDPRLGSARTAMPRVSESPLTFGLLVATDDEVLVADALVRLWERAFASRQDRTLRILLGPAPSPGVVNWMAQLMMRLQLTNSDAPARASRTNVHGVTNQTTEDQWPWALRSLDVLITPSCAPSVPSVWPIAAALGLPLIAARSASTESWVAASGGWTIPVASTGRFEWPALAAACESASDPQQRAERSQAARAAFAALPDGRAFLDAVMTRIARRP
ncbi:glycosyltransferase [Gemmatimonas sp.]|uniref:glycosyltransferase n=1 Tax=Gemmatimonas sp. TaxID=1962908 RepID=UPI00286ACBA9|nr:glycosyltransferase [Gemmatimonas sp.]